MKKIVIFMVLLASILIFFFTGCFVPIIEKQTNLKDKTILTNNEQNKIILASHPKVYEAKIEKNSGGILIEPSLIWAGNVYGIVWVNQKNGDDEIYFARVSKFGAKIGLPTLIASGNNPRHPFLIWTGSEYGVTWADGQILDFDIYFTRVSSSGSKIGNTIRISDDDNYYSFYPSLVWTGSEYGVVWEDDRNGNSKTYKDSLNILPKYIPDEEDGDGIREIYFVRISENGSKIGNDARISTDDNNSSYDPFLTWTGSEYGVVWNDRRDLDTEIYFARINENGSKIGNDTRLTNDDYFGSYYPELVWTGNEYGVTWMDDRNEGYEIYFAKISESSSIGSGKRITYNDGYDSVSPSAVWTGIEYGMAWVENKSGVTEIYFTRFNTHGNKLIQGGLVGALTDSQDGYYYIKNATYGTYLYGDGSTLYLREYDSENPDLFKWKLSDTNNDGYYYIKNKDSNRYLTGLINGDGNLTGTLGLSTGGDQTNIHNWQLDSRLDTGLGKYILRIKKDENKRIYASGETSVDLRSSYGYWHLIPAGF